MTAANRPDYAHLRRLAAAATPGRWHNSTNRHPNTDGTPWGCLERAAHPAGGAGTPLFKGFCWSGSEAQRTADFIAAARPDVVVALLDELDTLRAASDSQSSSDVPT